MADPEPKEQASKLVTIATRLRQDAATAEVLRSFDRAGVEALLLKGPSISTWLFPENGPRTYLDCDLLIAPTDRERAEEALASLGYTRLFDDRGMPLWWREHASTWRRDEDGLMVDLHRTLPGVGVDPDATWSTLSADTDVVVVAGYRAPTLTLSARALHVALHAAQHGIVSTGPMDDLRRAVAAGDDDLWLRASALATELKAIDPFAAGLRLTPAGVQLARRLALPPSTSVDAQLRASSAPPAALGFEQLARADGMVARAQIALHKLVPPADFMRHWDPRAAESPSRLARAYLRRPIWIMRQAPRALHAWLRSRHGTRGTERADKH